MKDIIYIIRPKLRDGYLTYRNGPDGMIWKTFPSVKAVKTYADKWGFSIHRLPTGGV